MLYFPLWCLERALTWFPYQGLALEKATEMQNKGKGPGDGVLYKELDMKLQWARMSPHSPQPEDLKTVILFSGSICQMLQNLKEAV